MTFELGIQHLVLWAIHLMPYKVCSSDDPGSSLTFFMAKLN